MRLSGPVALSPLEWSTSGLEERHWEHFGRLQLIDMDKYFLIIKMRHFQRQVLTELEPICLDLVSVGYSPVSGRWREKRDKIKPNWSSSALGPIIRHFFLPFSKHVLPLFLPGQYLNTLLSLLNTFKAKKSFYRSKTGTNSLQDLVSALNECNGKA